MNELIFGILLIFGLGIIVGWYMSNTINKTRYESILKNSAMMMGMTREVWERIIKAKRMEHGVQKKNVQQDSEKNTSE
ncbi:uncharacterized protein METZ01_LOCUS175882 [marine metagenome]|uniref:Uncharacterized protein n=1 Tax=marine metagenome TaxID=408172 RepID=A0A382CA82_9ZZZZ|tara:strand:- start:29982 stop:30215 length:234 start_codon:yes stop_codon:yes gene_type:complete